MATGDLGKAFRRETDGAWTCVASIDFVGPNGRLQIADGTRVRPGQTIMGVELASWLDAKLVDSRSRAGPPNSAARSAVAKA